MKNRSRLEIERDTRLKELRSLARDIHNADTLISVRNLAEQLQELAFDLKDWAADELAARGLVI